MRADRAHRLSRGTNQAAKLNGDVPAFSPRYRWAAHTLACDVVALDPATVNGEGDFARTTLCRAMMTGLVRQILKQTLGDDIGWALARTRVVIPRTGGVTGALTLHMERSILAYPRIHNIWLPLLPAGVESNTDAPGLQMFVGSLDFFKSGVEADVSEFMTGLAEASREDHPVANVRGFLFRPKLTTGDLVIFSGSVPHASYIPPAATRSRVGCDVRLFPWTQDDHLPNVDERAAPHRLIWAGNGNDRSVRLAG